MNVLSGRGLFEFHRRNVLPILMQDKAIDLAVVISHEGELGIHHLVEEFIIAGRENWKRWLSRQFSGQLIVLERDGEDGSGEHHVGAHVLRKNLGIDADDLSDGVEVVESSRWKPMLSTPR